VIAAVLAVLIMLAAGTSLWARLAAPSDLAVLSVREQPWAAGGPVVATDLAPGGLREGDRIVSVGGRPVAWWALRLGASGVTRPVLDTSSPLEYQVVRDGRLITVPVTARPYRLAATVACHWSTVLLLLLLWMVAGVAFARSPRNPASQAALGFASLYTWAATAWVFGLEASDLVTATGFWRWLGGELANALLWGALLHFVLVYPRPCATLARRRSLLWLCYVAPIALHGLYLLAWLPQVADPLERVRLLASPIMLAQMVFPAAALAILVHRYRATVDTLTSQRLRGLAVTLAAGTAMYLAIWIAPALLTGEPLLTWSLRTAVFLPCPVALAAAIVRHQAFDIDHVVNRALVYGFLTAGVITLYVTTVGLLSELLHERADFGISLSATGLVAVMFNPLRERLQRVVNHLLYGYRHQPYEAISQLGQRLETTLVPERVLPAIVETAAQALRLPYAAIELVGGDPDEVAAAHGRRSGAVVRLPLTYQGETIGWLSLSPRGPTETFSTADYRLLKDLARQAGVAVHLVRLTADLQRSRDHLVRSREEERRRLRRDLHDGLGPTLTGMTMQVGAARALPDGDGRKAYRVLAELERELQACVLEVRRLVDDLRPPALDQLGLVSAIRHRLDAFGSAAYGSALQVVISAPHDLGDLPAAVEAAAYRITTEAVTNTVRHAAASRCNVRLELQDDLAVEVVDDGIGLPDRYQPGIGLTSMRERAEELGGTFTAQRVPGGGTRIRAELPLTAR